MTGRPLFALAACALLVAATTACENEGRSEEARATVLRYLAALDGAEDDRGWSILSEPMRELSGPGDAYLELAMQAEAPMTIESVTLQYEDDGFYDFTVTAGESIDGAHAAILFDQLGTGSPIACSIGARSFRIAVIVGVLMFTEHAGVTGNECPEASGSEPLPSSAGLRPSKHD